MKTTIILTFLFAFTLINYGQEKEVTSYKYILVNEKFDFLKEKDQYQTSSLTQFLLKKNGFEVFLKSDKLPNTLQENLCKSLIADVQNESSMFKTKVKIVLKDCFNKVVYTSNIGGSKAKDYKKSYQEAIRNAFKSMSNIAYKVTGNKQVTSLGELETTKNNQIGKQNNNSKDISKKIPLNVIKDNVKETNLVISTNIKQLYAQPKDNGFQLINLKPEVVFIILYTTLKNTYILKDKNGILYKKDSFWLAEYYKEGKLITEKYQIKF